MRDVGDAIRREGKREPGHQTGSGAPRQLATEQEHTQTGQRERRQKEQVVAENRVPRQRVDWQRLQRLRKKVL
jgi:hypothetical protein